jgi:molecular chaperone GrpE
MTEREREHDGHGAAATAAPEGRDEAPAGRDEAPDEVGLLRARAADYEDRWKRAVAEFQNYRRRIDSERAEVIRGANGALLREVLPVLDDLERVLANIPPEFAAHTWVEGARLVERKLRAIMARQGLTPIEAVGRPFDPALHEAIGGTGTHVERECQRGYRLNGRTVRPALVIVGDAPAAPDEPAA